MSDGDGHCGRKARMDGRLSRRQLLRWGVYAGAALLPSSLLAACGGQAGGTTSKESPTAGRSASAGPTPQTSLSGAHPTAARSGLKGQLVIWTFFSEVKLFAQQFEQRNPGVRVDVKVFPGNDYETKMRLALQTGQSAPDIFDLERGYIGKYLDAPFTEDLTPMGAEKLIKGYVPYTAALGRDQKGLVKAVTDNASPGGFWYRRDVVQEYLGTSDPMQVSSKVNSWDRILEIGKRMARQSKGKVHLLAHYSDVIMVNQYWMKPWVEDGRLVIDLRWNDVLDTVRKIRQEGVDAKLDPFSPSWGAAWNDGSVAMFAWPSWAEFLIDKKKTYGKWGVAKAPRGYYSGGTYRAIYKGSQNKKLAFELIRFIAQPAWQNYNLDHTQNMPALKSVYKSRMDSYRPGLLDRQPVLKVYYPIAMQVPPRSPDKYGESIQAAFNDAVSDMIRKHESNEQAFAALKQKVRSEFPELRVQ